MNPHADRAPRSLLRCSTRTICFLALLVPVCAVVFPPPVFSQQKMDVPRLHARAETYLQFFYNAPTDAYNVDIPLYTTVSLSYESSRVASLFSIDYATELTLGETYVRGGTEYSSMQIGYSVVDWGVGYSLSPLGEVNPFDSRYPDNIFYRTHYAPYPGFITTFGNSGFYNQLFIGKIDESRQSLDSTDFGIRGVVKSGKRGRVARADLGVQQGESGCVDLPDRDETTVAPFHGIRRAHRRPIGQLSLSTGDSAVEQRPAAVGSNLLPLAGVEQRSQRVRGPRPE
jgi:hypothetical protein